MDGLIKSNWKCFLFSCIFAGVIILFAIHNSGKELPKYADPNTREEISTSTLVERK